MVIVWGSVEVSANDLKDVLDISLEHVRRSREEPGCVTHSVQVDAENPHRLVFFEEWENMPALQTHFKVPASAEFVQLVSKKATSAPVMNIYEASLANPG